MGANLGEVPEHKGETTSVFISYSRRDGEVADRLHRRLERAGLDPYLDKMNYLLEGVVGSIT